MIVDGIDTFELRPQRELEDGYEQVRAELAENERIPALQGRLVNDHATLACLAWVLGKTDVSPLVGLVGIDATDPKEIRREWVMVDRMMRGEVSMDHRGRDYVSGVDHGLLWVCGQAVTPL